jgi:hypothetical protein
MTGRGKARLSAEKVAEIFMDSDSENYLFDDDSDDSSAEWDPARGRGQGRAARQIQDGPLLCPYGQRGCRVCKKRGTVKSVKLNVELMETIKTNTKRYNT